MKTIVVASKNPVKIQAVEAGFRSLFPEELFEVVGVSVPSGVSDQPMTDEETFLGAKNRADRASLVVLDADLFVGIEGGVEGVGSDELACFAWVVVKSGDQYGKARTGTFFLPKPVVALIKEGKELGEADDIVFGRTNSKQESGAVGILTGGVVDRAKYYTEAVILALIPLKNPELF